ncbi:hypothetical protein [Desulfofalx alkaliphila]|uniref:hypothetical protein n=1 Tax=Desulfofalx alkaliphila TaxID=105483 RepID=UPI0004E0B2CC|nr:hypothetical protein [Desulfofalx alkaliphila]
MSGKVIHLNRKRKKDIYAEVAELTKDDPNNYLITSLGGQVSLRGKFVKKNGKLEPVLLKVQEQKSPPLSRWSTLTDISCGPQKKDTSPWYRKLLACLRLHF